MFRKMLSGGGILLLVGAAALVTPGSGWAHGGGGHIVGGGPLVGGGPVVGGHVGFSHYGYPQAYYHSNYGYSHYPFYGVWGGSFSTRFGASGYTGPGSASRPWSYGAGWGPTSSELEVPPPVTPPPADSAALADTRAHITAHVPAEARVWFDGMATTSTGQTRKFQSPPLSPGDQYSYEIKASWNENGRVVTQTRTVEVISGAHVDVKFAVTPKTEVPGSAVQKN
jgi:uncharacterized protein (TIGR03000 family)